MPRPRTSRSYSTWSSLPIGRVLQTSPAGTDPAAGLFAKQGLVVRIGALVDLRIGDASVGHAGIGWGNPGTDGDHVRVEATNCHAPSTAQWVAFAGGYYVNEPMCVPIVVEAGAPARSSGSRSAQVAGRPE